MKLCCKCNKEIKRDAWYGLHPACFKAWFDVHELLEFQDITRRDRDGTRSSFKSTFFHGNFYKYSAVLNDIRYILKLEEDEYPELPVVEYVSNEIFKILGIDIAPFYLIEFQGLRCFVTENIMTQYSEANLIHLYRFLTSEDIYDCAEIQKIIAQKTENIAAQESLVYLTLADSLIGNNDRHGRNLALIETGVGYELSPFYDNVSNIGIEIEEMLGADLNPKGCIVTRDEKEPTMKHYVEEWTRLDFGPIVEKFKINLKDSYSDILRAIEESPLTEKRKRALIRLVAKRKDELCQ